MSAAPACAQRILSDRTFRLLRLLPALNEAAPLQCECRPFDIDNAPPYEALSYVWGAPTPSADISCNGQRVEIGLSLSQALKRLRLEEADRIIWADAICINQADEAEKSHQVPMMGSIYSLAKRVVVWLGEGDAQQSRMAFDASRAIVDACHDYCQRHDIIPDRFTDHGEVDLPQIMASDHILSSLEDLYDRPWFHRIWCIQEIRLAADALVIWGDDEISWSALATSARWLFDQDAPDETGTHKDGHNPALLWIESRNAVMMSEKTTYQLLDALKDFCDYESSDSRDKVYGLVNIVSPRSEVEALDINYEKTVDQVFADTVLSIIKVYSRLTAFGYIMHEVDYDGPSVRDHENPGDDEEGIIYRSWAPQWESGLVYQPIGIPESIYSWSACGEHEQTITVGSCSVPELLCLKGVAYSKVTEIEEIMGFGNLSDPKYVSKPTCLDSPAGIEPGNPDAKDIHFKGIPTERHPFIEAFKRPDVNSSPDRFARTLIAGKWNKTYESRDLENVSVQTKYGNACSHYLSRLLHLRDFGNEGDYTHNRDSAQFGSDSWPTCLQRRLFWTERGSYGLGPQCMRTGDIVVVLYGGNTPYVLRPRGDKYIFMGQAYVDEIMNGELFQGLASDVPEEQTFCLI